MELQIRYIGYQNEKYMFEVVRSRDMKRTEPVALPAPTDYQVVGRPAKKFLPELRWYLEKYLDEPYGAYQQMAEGIEETIEAWGTAIFDALFTGYARDWYQEARRANFEGLRIKIASDLPEIMSWPWEALYCRDDGYLAMRCCIERQLIDIGDPLPLPANLSQDAIHILYVISRPYGNRDINYHALAGNLVNYISQSDLPVTVDVLRPPTFDQLRKVLCDNPGYYHVVHFDGHGGYGAAEPTPSEHRYAAPVGRLVFESDNKDPDPVDTKILAQLLAEHRIPIMVMNACQSGMIDGQAQDQFACVAAGLLKAGIRNVVAMGYSLYVSGAQEFVPVFYERLLSTGSVSEAVRAGRSKMLRQQNRNSVVGKTPLQDWIVPVLYQQSDGSALLPEISKKKQSKDDSEFLPEEARVLGDYGFIGRGSEIQKLERAILRQKQAAILIHGQAGVGKTTLAKGFLHWLKNTGGLKNGAFWFNFQEIHSAEYVINGLITAFGDFSATAMPMEDKLKALVQILRNEPFILVWDNFESASGIENTEIQPQLSGADREILKNLLTELRGGKTKVLITSRTNEDWLPSPRICYHIPIEGLYGEELWEYCNAVVQDLGLTLDRNNDTYPKILEKLCGNPLVIRAILLRLQDSSAEQLLFELETAFEGMKGDESTDRLQAAYKVFGEKLVKRFLPILQVTGLHEYYAVTDLVESMLEAAGMAVEVSEVTECYHILENAGFCTHIGNNIYRLHPALRGYLARQTPASEDVQRGFVDVMGSFADYMVDMPIHLTREFYEINLANFYHAKQLADELEMNEYFMALAQSLANYAQNNRRFSEANALYLSLAEKARVCDDFEGVASAYHQLGMVAAEQQDFTSAEAWYKKSLEISEKQGNEHGAALTYHQLGIVAEKQGDYPAAEAWYKKSMEIKEKQGDEYGAAGTYHQLGIVAAEQGDYPAAEAWYKKSLEIEEKQGDEYGAASTYHQLGMIAEEQGDYPMAEAWYKKSLEINEKLGIEQYAARTYHQLGIVAAEQGDYPAAEAWYKKSLEISEKLGIEQYAAMTYGQLGNLSKNQGDFPKAAYFYLKAIESFMQTNDPHKLMITIRAYAILLRAAPDEERDRLRKIWSEHMPDEMTDRLKEAEAALYGTNE